MITRTGVRSKRIGTLNTGPISVLRIVCADGRKSWGVSFPGHLTLFGLDRARANRYARKMLFLFSV